MSKATTLTQIPADAPVNNWGVPACPECGRDNFKARKALGRHRSAAHGIEGTSPSAKRSQKQKEALKISPIPPDAKTNKFGVPICPECGRDDFKFMNTLAYHRRQDHNIAGESNRLFSSPLNKTPCPHCPLKFKNQRGLTVHLSTMHGVRGSHSKLPPKEPAATAITLSNQPTNKKGITHESRNGHSQSIEVSKSTEPPLTAEDLIVFQTIGELKGHCRYVAESAGFPTAQFTARVIAALYSQTRR